MGKRIKKVQKVERTVDLGMEKRYLLEVPENVGLKVAKLHNIGKRKNQQDSFGVSELKEEILTERGFLAVVADGMGGLSDGEKASMATVISALNFFDIKEFDVIPDNLTELAEMANQQVKEVLGITKGQSGSTMVCIYIKDKQMFFVSVGDSRILLLRDGEIHQLNQEHNYEADLMKLVKDGRITLEEAQNDPQKNALTSYIGIEKLEKIDRNTEPIELFDQDRILLVSDGIYNTLSDEEILASMEYPIGRAMMHMEMQIEGKNKTNQDNYTALLVEIGE